MTTRAITAEDIEEYLRGQAGVQPAAPSPTVAAEDIPPSSAAIPITEQDVEEFERRQAAPETTFFGPQATEVPADFPQRFTTPEIGTRPSESLRVQAKGRQRLRELLELAKGERPATSVLGAAGQLFNLAGGGAEIGAASVFRRPEQTSFPYALGRQLEAPPYERFLTEAAADLLNLLPGVGFTRLPTAAARGAAAAREFVPITRPLRTAAAAQAAPPAAAVPPAGPPPARPPGAPTEGVPPPPVGGRRALDIEPFEAPANRLLGVDTAPEIAIRKIPVLRQVYGAIDPAAIHQSEPVARLGISKEIFKETHHASAKVLAMEWMDEAQQTLGFRNGKAMLAEPAQGVARGPLFRTIFDLVEHPERYNLTPPQQATITRAQDIMASVLKAEQAAGVDVGEVANYWYREVIGKEGEGLLTRLVTRAGRGSPKGHTKSRFYEFAEDTVNAGKKLNLDPLSSLTRRLEAGISAIADKETLTRIAQLPGMETGRLPRMGEGDILGKVAPEELIDEIDKWVSVPGRFGPRVEGSGLPTEALRLWRSTMVSLDLSAGYIQGQTLFFRNTPAWLRAQAASVTALLKEPLSYVAKHSDTIEEGIRNGAIVPPSEYLFARRGLAAAPTQIPVFGQAFTRANRAFEWFTFVGQHELYKAAKGNGKAEAELVQLGGAIRKIMGTESYAILGVSRRQQAIEAYLAFAPRFYRATLGMVAQAATAGSGGDVARRAIGSMIAGATALTIGVNYLTTRKMPNFTEVDTETWGKAKLRDNRYVSFYGPFHSLFRTLARAGVYTAQGDQARAMTEIGRYFRSKGSLPVKSLETGARVAITGSARTFEGERIDLTPEGALNYLQEQAPIGPAQVAKGLLRGQPEQVLQIGGLNITEANREKAGEYERAGQLPPLGTNIRVLSTAWYQAGEGRLSPEGRRAWRKYEPLRSAAERKALLYTFPVTVRREVNAVEEYRTTRREQLSRRFPELDVFLVEEKFKAKDSYTPKTQKGKQRQKELLRSRYGGRNEYKGPPVETVPIPIVPGTR